MHYWHGRKELPTVQWLGETPGVKPGKGDWLGGAHFGWLKPRNFQQTLAKLRALFGVCM